MSPSPMDAPQTPPLPAIQTWIWQGWPITYQQQGLQGPAVVLVHGFGASLGHWRKNIPVLAQACRVYALDLIGFGGSAKPAPGEAIAYTFETWGQQIGEFCQQVVGEPVYLVANSIGCIASMQAAVDYPEQVRGIVQLNFSLRLLHERFRAQQPWVKRVGVPLVQTALLQPWLGALFFRLLARPQTVRKVLLQAYARPEAVTDELVELLLKPAQDPGAVGVFLAFTGYAQGPLPEDLLPRLSCSTLILWGEEDPWEPIGLGQKFADYPAVDRFIPLPGVGHCPQDEAPELVNPLILAWILAKAA